MLFGPNNLIYPSKDQYTLAVCESGLVLLELNNLYKTIQGKRGDKVYCYIDPEVDRNNGCYFKCNRGSILNTDVEPFRIWLKGPEYFYHNINARNRDRRPLNNKEKENLNEILSRDTNSDQYKDMSVWVAFCTFFNNHARNNPNMEKFMIKNPKREMQPDYTLLPDVFAK